MGREIKYRAWEKHRLQMVSVSTIQFPTSFNPGYAGTFKEDDIDCLIPYGDGEPVILMQYTGLKDKNGVEIYEGDIVKFTSRSGLKAAFLGRVIWPEDYAGFCVTANDGGYLDAIKWLHDIDVIGNIYENPKLLEGEIK